MSFEVRDQNTFVNQAVAVAQAVNPALTDVGPGSVANALFQGTAFNQVCVQLLAIALLGKVHLATSKGGDVDTWLAPYGLTRLGASAATGVVTCSRYSATSPMLVPPGTSFKTVDLSQAYIVTTDTTNAAWNASLGGYLCPAGIFSVDVPVQAVVAAAAGNVQAGTITVVATAIAGLNSCSNALPTTGGADPEGDDALRARFPKYLASLGRATDDAVQRAVDSVQPGLFSLVQENTNGAGQQQLGFFTVLVNDGTPSPPAALLDSVRVAVNAVRPLSVLFSVLPTPVIPAVVTVTTTVAPAYNPATQRALVQTAVEAYINALGINEPLYFYRLASVIDSIPGVDATSSAILLNGATADLPSATTSVIRTSSVTVS